jgi:hypothetical protein
MLDGDDANVAGEESDVASTSVTSSRPARGPMVKSSFAFVVVVVREGVDPHSEASKPRLTELVWAAANAAITPDSMSRAENRALPTGLSLSVNSSPCLSSTWAKRRRTGVVGRARRGESKPSSRRTRRFNGLSQPPSPCDVEEDDGAGLRARLREEGLPLGVGPLDPPSKYGSRDSSSSGRRMPFGASMRMCCE